MALALAGSGSIDGEMRAAVRKELEWDGFALLGPGVLAQPAADPEGLLDALDELRVGSIAYSPLEQGLLTARYLDGIPEDSRAASDSPFLDTDAVTGELVGRLRTLNEIAGARGQTLAQMALAWVLRGGRVTSALVGASSPRQLEDSVAATRNLDFDADELARIDAAVKR